MFHENANVPKSEPGSAALENQPTLATHLNAEKPINPNDVDGLKDVAWMTPATFYWTRGNDGQLRLAYPKWKTLYFAEAAKLDDNNLEEHIGAFASGDEYDDTLSSEELDKLRAQRLSTVRGLTSQMIKSTHERLRILDAYDVSGWLGNEQRRNDALKAAMAAIEIVYWKDERAMQIAKIEAKKGDVESDSWLQSIESFIDRAIQNHYFWSNVAIASCPDGEYLVDENDKRANEPGRTTLARAADSFLRMQAASQQKRILAAAKNKDTELALKSEGAKARDPQAQKRAELMAKYKAA